MNPLAMSKAKTSRGWLRCPGLRSQGEGGTAKENWKGRTIRGVAKEKE